jgi:adenylosuccinate synthase
MPVTVVVGGQYGSEGKGKVAQHLAAAQDARAVVRVGGSNSGHTVWSAMGDPVILRHLPTAALLPDVLCVIGAGSYIDLSVLLAEIDRVQIPTRRLVIDANAAMITDDDRQAEASSGIIGRIGSTGSGTGSAVARRVGRSSAVLASAVPELARYVDDAPRRLREILDAGGRVVIEGTQGFGLSLLHSPHYPKTTSRDTTAASALSEAGLSPLDVDQVVLVLRAFPIRVAGNSGNFGSEELSWKTIAREGGHRKELAEYTSVTRRLRRVARFDPHLVRQAISCNQPSLIVLNHVDYVDARCASGSLTRKSANFIDEVARRIGRPIDLVGVGPDLLIPFRDTDALAA